MTLRRGDRLRERGLEVGVALGTRRGNLGGGRRGRAAVGCADGVCGCGLARLGDPGREAWRRGGRGLREGRRGGGGGGGERGGGPPVGWPGSRPRGGRRGRGGP